MHIGEAVDEVFSAPGQRNSVNKVVESRIRTQQGRCCQHAQIALYLAHDMAHTRLPPTHLTTKKANLEARIVEEIERLHMAVFRSC